MEQLIDSSSIGDPSRFRPLDELERALAALPAAPRDVGTVRLLVTRHAEPASVEAAEGAPRARRGVREALARAAMTLESGMPARRTRHPPPEAQLAVMQIAVAELIANGQPLTLFGDNLFVDLDLSSAALPPGSRLRAGTVTLEVTPEPHDGCRKFRARFGDGALRLVSRPDLRHLNLRGVYMRVVEAGEVAVGDALRVIARPPAATM